MKLASKYIMHRMKFILDPPLLRRRRRNPLHRRRRRLLLRSNAGQGKSADIKWSMKRTRTKRRPLQSTLTELREARFHDYLAPFLGSTSTVTNQQVYTSFFFSIHCQFCGSSFNQWSENYRWTARRRRRRWRRSTEKEEEYCFSIWSCTWVRYVYVIYI